MLKVQRRPILAAPGIAPRAAMLWITRSDRPVIAPASETRHRSAFPAFKTALICFSALLDIWISTG